MQPQRLEDHELTGKGLTSEVYAWRDGRVLKLYHDWVLECRVERYFKAARAAHSVGLPVPAAYEVVEFEGRHGIVFERLEGVSMLRQVQARPWTLFAATRKLAELHAQIHSYVASPELPTQRQRIRDRIAAVRDVSEADKQAARLCLEKLPDGEAVCHGDFHPENVLFTARDPLIIDWDGASHGDPLGDVACTSRLLQTASLPPHTTTSNVGVPLKRWGGCMPRKCSELWPGLFRSFKL